MDMRVRWPIVTPMGLTLAVAAAHDCEELDQLVETAMTGVAGRAQRPAFDASTLLRWIDARRSRGSGLWCVRLRGVAQGLIGCVAAWPCATSSVRRVAVALQDESHQQRYTLDVVRGLSAHWLASTWDEDPDPVPAAPGLIASPITLLQLCTLPLPEDGAAPDGVAPWPAGDAPVVDPWMLRPLHHTAPTPHSLMRRRYER
jgi:hypothetical protein